MHSHWRRAASYLALCVTAWPPLAAMPAEPVVIAHRGASGYLPEHTLASKALAHAMQADYIEQDVVLTRDGIPIVLHDIYLDSTTDVEQRFPDRPRKDGRYYALDFSLAEIRQLNAHERTRRDKQGQTRQVYPERFPLGKGRFQVPTLAEEIELIAGLDRSRGRSTGLYIELKAPRWHREQGHDLAAAVIEVLEQTGYANRPGQVYLQCFDPGTLKRLHQDFETPLPLIQLIGENDWGEDGGTDYDAMRTDAGLDQVATYAAGIGPWIPQLLTPVADGQLRSSGLAQRARNRGLLIHPYTLRADQLPDEVADLDALHHALFDGEGVDGVFTDFPDLTRAYLDRRNRRR